jgi:hypothetical protein
MKLLLDGLSLQSKKHVTPACHPTEKKNTSKNNITVHLLARTLASAKALTSCSGSSLRIALSSMSALWHKGNSDMNRQEYVAGNSIGELTDCLEYRLPV